MLPTMANEPKKKPEQTISPVLAETVRRLEEKRIPAWGRKRRKLDGVPQNRPR